MSPLKTNQSFEKRGLANLSSPELAMYSPKGSKPFHPRPPSCNRSDLFWRYVSEHDLKELMERLAHLLVPSELERFGVDAITNIFITEASDTLRTNPVEP